MSWILLLTVAAILLIPRLAVGSDRARQRNEVHGGLWVLWWINRFYCGLLHRLRLFNKAQLPTSGPAMLIANHTCGIDNFLLQAGCDRVLGFVIAQEWYDHKVCGIFSRMLGCIPVRRDGRDVGATREALRALERGRVLPIFPEGRIGATSGQTFLEGLHGAAFLALKSRVPVIPAYIRGTPPTRNVLAAVITPSRSQVIFGPPVDLADLETNGRGVDREAVETATSRMMAAIARLKVELEAEAGPLGADPGPASLPEPHPIARQPQAVPSHVT